MGPTRPSPPSARSASGSPSSEVGPRMTRLVLASGSPQRRAIIGDLGLDFEVRAPDVAEEDEGTPRVVASENALRTALAGAEAGGPDAGEPAIGCDTLVATEHEIWGKPPPEAAARDTLRRLWGHTHEV